MTQDERIRQALVGYEMLRDGAVAHVRERDPSDLQHLASCCFDVFFCHAHLRSDDSRGALLDLVGALTASLKIPLNVGSELRYRFRGAMHAVVPEARSYRASPHHWNVAFFGAVLLGDDEALRVLSAIDLGALVAITPRKPNHSYSMALALQAFARGVPGYPALLAVALEESLAVQESDLQHAKAMDIDGPALELLVLLLRDDRARFDAKLADALAWHARYHARLVERGIQDNSGLVSLPICAMVKLARTLKKLSAAVASDAAPEALLAWPAARLPVDAG